MVVKNGDPQMSWTTVAGAVAIVGLMNSAQWVVMRTQFDNVTHTQETSESTIRDRDRILLDRIVVLEAQGRVQAHDPVEKATIDVIVDAINKRDDLFQAQITDLNRQIAAALIIIDNNSMKRVPLPP